MSGKPPPRIVGTIVVVSGASMIIGGALAAGLAGQTLVGIVLVAVGVIDIGVGFALRVWSDSG